MTDADRDDATRYRWLLANMQLNYDGYDTSSTSEVVVSCQMVNRYGSERRVRSFIEWKDLLDAPLDLSTAIDKAIEEEMRKGTK